MLSCLVSCVSLSQCNETTPFTHAKPPGTHLAPPPWLGACVVARPLGGAATAAAPAAAASTGESAATSGGGWASVFVSAVETGGVSDAALAGAGATGATDLGRLFVNVSSGRSTRRITMMASSSTASEHAKRIAGVTRSPSLAHSCSGPLCGSRPTYRSSSCTGHPCTDTGREKCSQPQTPARQQSQW